MEQTTKINAAQTLFFADKEDYLNFRKLWATKVNDENEKHKLPAHLHMLYTILRGRDVKKGFKICYELNEIKDSLKRSYTKSFEALGRKNPSDEQRQFITDVLSQIVQGETL